MSARSYNLNKRRQGNITVKNGGMTVQLHNTDVVDFYHTFIKLNSGGYFTRTTATAINRYFSLQNIPAYVSFSKRGNILLYKGEQYNFYDGMQLNLDGGIVIT